MIDTVLLCSDDYRWRGLGQGGRFNTKTTTDENGEIVGEMRFNNTERRQVDNKGGLLQVQTSLPKLLYQTSLREVTERDYQKAVRQLDAELQEIGVEVAGGVAGMGVHRLDYCRNLTMRGDVADSIAVLSQFSVARRLREMYGHETMSNSNKSRGFIFYDKVEEVRTNKGTPDEEKTRLLTVPHNILRAEFRMKRRKIVEKTLHLAHPQLRDVWSADLRRKVLLEEFDRMTESPEDMTEILTASQVAEFLAEHRRGGVWQLVKQFGVPVLMQKFDGDYLFFRRMMVEAGIPERSARRWIGRLRRVAAGGIKLSPAGEVLREIRRKLAA